MPWGGFRKDRFSAIFTIVRLATTPLTFDKPLKSLKVLPKGKH